MCHGLPHPPLPRKHHRGTLPFVLQPVQPTFSIQNKVLITGMLTGSVGLFPLRFGSAWDCPSPAGPTPGAGQMREMRAIDFSKRVGVLLVNQNLISGGS